MTDAQLRMMHYFVFEVDFGDSCVEVDGMCPDTCQALVTTLDSVCPGKSHTDVDGGEEVTDKLRSFLVFNFLSMAPARMQTSFLVKPPALRHILTFLLKLFWETVAQR